MKLADLNWGAIMSGMEGVAGWEERVCMHMH